MEASAPLLTPPDGPSGGYERTLWLWDEMPAQEESRSTLWELPFVALAAALLIAASVCVARPQLWDGSWARKEALALRGRPNVGQVPAWAANDGITKGTCQQYFGVDTNLTSLLITVVDLDARDGFPLGNLTVVHHSGPYSPCFSPAPPAGTHRYVKTYYWRCAPLEDGPGGAHVAWAGAVDEKGRFDRRTGALRRCAADVVRVEMSCWGAPADSPQKQDCTDLLATAGSAGRLR